MNTAFVIPCRSQVSLNRCDTVGFAGQAARAKRHVPVPGARFQNQSLPALRLPVRQSGQVGRSTHSKPEAANLAPPWGHSWRYPKIRRRPHQRHFPGFDLETCTRSNPVSPVRPS